MSICVTKDYKLKVKNLHASHTQINTVRNFFFRNSRFEPVKMHFQEISFFLIASITDITILRIVVVHPSVNSIDAM